MRYQRCSLLLALLVGCGGPTIPPRIPVKGQVLYQGKARAGITVVFHPLFDVGPIKFKPSARTDRDGYFELTSAETGDGAPAGEYAVTFDWPTGGNPEEGIAAKDFFKGRYAEPSRSPWKRTIEPNMQPLEPFQLK